MGNCLISVTKEGLILVEFKSLESLASECLSDGTGSLESVGIYCSTHIQF